MLMLTYNPTRPAHPEPWNKGKLVGPKPPFKLQEIWAIRIRLQIEHRTRELAMFNLAVDSKLRSCDLVRLKVSDIMHGRYAVTRAMVIQHMGGIRCGAQKRPWSIVGPRTFEPSSSCLATPS